MRSYIILFIITITTVTSYTQSVDWELLTDNKTWEIESYNNNLYSIDLEGDHRITYVKYLDRYG